MLNNFSPNMLKTYQTCPKKFYTKYIEWINVPISSIPFEKGKKIHALANYFHKGINISRIETALTSNEKEIWAKLLNNQYYQKEPYKSEYQISCKIGNYWIGGRLDAVVHDFEDYYILDYKTGAVPKDSTYDFQTMVYLLTLDKILKSYNSLKFVYIDLKNDKNHVIEFNDELKKTYEEKIIEACDTISNDNSFKPNSNSCKNCEYSSICKNYSTETDY